MDQYCIIPAAGRSSRMGAWKPLLPWGETTVCGAVLATALSLGLKPIIVAGYRAPELAAAFENIPGVDLVVNDDWAKGMLGSIRLGSERALALSSEHASTSVHGFFVAPADMPMLPKEAFVRIASFVSIRSASEPGAVFASRGSRLGHPVWIPYAFIPEISSLPPEARLRDFLLAKRWASVDIDSEGIFTDIDTPEAYDAHLLQG